MPPRATTSGGVLVGFGVTPLGWGRLFPCAAADHRDRIAPLASVTGPAFPAALALELAEAHGGGPDAMAQVLDRLLAPRLAEPGPDEPAIAALTAALADPAATNVGDVAARIGLADGALRRLATRYFGMMPKLLIRRARFLRSFLAFFRVGEASGYARIDESYHDVSHFLRDADRFLGATPRRFAAHATPLLDASLRARAAALGAATCALQPPAPTRPSEA